MASDGIALELTVIVPCYNVEETLAEQLDALMAEDWSGPWGVLVVDNGSTDRTREIAESYANRSIQVQVLSATDGQSVAYARNAGIAAANSPHIAICDGDDVVQPGWIAAMGNALRANRLVGGIVDPTILNPTWLAHTRPIGTPGELPRFGNAPFVSGGNCGMHRDLWLELGGYDEGFNGLEDIEFSLRARALGVEPAPAPGAVIGYRYREGIQPLWRQGFFYGRGRRELSRRAQALGLEGASSTAALKSWVWLVVNLPKLGSRTGRYSWVWVLANRIGAIRGLFDSRQDSSYVATPSTPRPVSETARFHGVLITYRRPGDLANSLEILAAQTHRLDTLTVVDNDADESVRLVVDAAAGTAGSVHYVASAENMGPAGGIELGVSEVLKHADEDDWVILFDDDDPPERADCLEELQRLLRELRERDPACAGVGLWGASLNRNTGRVRAATLTTPEPVDYLPGGSCPHYAVSTLRRVGAPPAAMFFGFDDLELGLRIRDAGQQLFSSGLAREHGLAHMVEGRRARLTSSPPSWRRYYSLRNLIIVLRDHGETRGALAMTLVAGVAKPTLNLLRRPRIAAQNLQVNLAAMQDGWSRKTGKMIEPS